jgi:hypothetical protein
MASTDVSSEAASGTQSALGVNMKARGGDFARLRCPLPVSDADRAKDFYASLGWRFDVDLDVSDDIRTVQFRSRLRVLGPVRQGRHDGRARVRTGDDPDGR